jgi:hypothetical protein
MASGGTIDRVDGLLGERRFEEAARLLLAVAAAGETAATAALAHWWWRGFFATLKIPSSALGWSPSRANAGEA